MKTLFTILFLLSCTSVSFAHNPDESHYKVRVEGSQTLIEAEFAWFLKNAIFEYAPRLKDPKNKGEFVDVFFEYVQKNIIIKNTQNEQLPLLDIKQLKQRGHSHQSNFLFTYEGNDIAHVTNTMLFNISEKHLNHHIFEGNKYLTTSATQSFGLKDIQEPSFDWRYLLLFVIPVLAIVVFVFKKEKTNS